MVKRKMTFTELINLPNKILHELYYRSYIEEERRQKEAKAKKEAEKAKANSGGHMSINEDDFYGIDEFDLEEALEDEL